MANVRYFETPQKLRAEERRDSAGRYNRFPLALNPSAVKTAHPLAGSQNAQGHFSLCAHGRGLRRLFSGI